MDVNLIKEIILKTIENAQVHVKDTNGTGDHFSILVISNQFINLSLIQRHQLIYSFFKEELTKEIHALQINTYTKEEWDKK